ncbi:GrpB family protein [Sinorhizobium sp. 8-89]|uniref:GrpB family protein n=1 Tax=Sinorhizobium sp. 7-81 TaxID=3049087 RepID=UPI0024C380F2|nr:GrpB family protein [Sinorhizobium sp. 7-81]MDK1386563.1 GrpB family protein [Sinorhizobium sp. 7-81]
MALTSKISEYDDRWPDMFDAEKARLEGVFGTKAVEIHHVGSTAVPGLAAKPEIDLLVVVSDHGDEAEISQAMASFGYVRGTNLSEGHHFYRRDVEGIRTHKVHVCLTGHWQISRMLLFRNMLRQDADLRRGYQNLKLELESTSEHGIGEYLARKAPFIDAVMGPPPKAQ